MSAEVAQSSFSNFKISPVFVGYVNSIKKDFCSSALWYRNGKVNVWLFYYFCFRRMRQYLSTCSCFSVKLCFFILCFENFCVRIILLLHTLDSMAGDSHCKLASVSFDMTAGHCDSFFVRQTSQVYLVHLLPSPGFRHSQTKLQQFQ